MRPSVPAPASLSVSQLLALTKSMLEDSFDSVWVEGEVANFRPAASGHWYFVLKEGQAELKVAMFRGRNLYSKLSPDNGKQLRVRGRLTVYEARGELQLIAEQIVEAGLGTQLKALEALKAKLAAEGLFAQDRKRKLPILPRRVALLTSPTGAAVHDFLSVCARRFPLLEIEIWPSLVQGEEAAAQLVLAVQGIAQHHLRYDAVVITRGGGSIQDLFCFNDEALVRAVAALPIPSISAVGHEVDTTLCDFAADVRAPTPTAAAELLTPDIEALHQRLSEHQRQLLRSWRKRHEPAMQRLDQLRHRLDAQAPMRKLLRMQEQLQRAKTQLENHVQLGMQRAKRAAVMTQMRLQQRNPTRQIAELNARLQTLTRQLQRTSGQRLQQYHAQLAHCRTALRTLSPERTLERGYTIVYDGQGHVISKLAALALPSDASIQWQDGKARATIKQAIRE